MQAKLCHLNQQARDQSWNNQCAQDQFWMKQCLILAEQGLATVSPNPMVGCIIIKNKRAIGCGWHLKSGGDHAEINALKTCAEPTQNATLYVNLEPCCHFGKTPPCVDKIINAGITRVVIAQQDPNPKVAGQSIIKLKQAGIEVVTDILSNEAYQQNRIFNYHITHRSPYIIAKWAMSLDGKMTCATGDDRQISGKKSWENTHRLRQQVDAILVGVQTVIDDNPSLTCRLDPTKTDVNSPARIILDTHGRTPLCSHILNDASGVPTLIATTNKAPATFIKAVAELGHRTLIIPDKSNRIDLAHLLKTLYQQCFYSLLVEGGPSVLHSFFAEDLPHETHTYIAPVIIGKGKTKTLLNTTKQQFLGQDAYITTSGSNKKNKQALNETQNKTERTYV